MTLPAERPSGAGCHLLESKHRWMDRWTPGLSPPLIPSRVRILGQWYSGAGETLIPGTAGRAGIVGAIDGI